MKVIFVNRFFHPDVSATAQMLADLAFGLVSRGANVLVITNRHRYDDANVTFPAHEHVRGVEILRVWTSRYGPAPLSARMYDYLSFYLFASLALAWRARRGDIVVAKTDPPLISVPMALVALLRGARLVNWAQDIYPEVAVRKQVRIALGTFGAVLRALRNFSLRRAVVNVVLGARMARLVQGLAGSDAKIEIIHNWADGEAVKPLPHAANPLRESWGLAGKFVIEYSGNMGQVHEFETILDAAQKLIDRPEIVFLFVGGGFYRGNIENEARSRNLSNLKFKPYQPREKLSESLGVGDVHLISLLPSMEGLVVPSKIYGILASGRPALHVGDPEGEVASILESAKAGFTIRPGEPELLAKRILDFAANPSLCSGLGLNARSAFDAHYSLQIAQDRWVRVLREIDPRALN